MEVPAVELVVKTACKRHAHQVACKEGEKDRWSEKTRTSGGERRLLAAPACSDPCNALTADASPSEQAKRDKNKHMHAKQTQRKPCVQKRRLGHKAPVDRPFVQKHAREIKRPASVGICVLEQEREAKKELDSADYAKRRYSTSRAQRTEQGHTQAREEQEYIHFYTERQTG